VRVEQGANARTAASKYSENPVLCSKRHRAKVSGCIERLQRQLDQRRADLTHIDGVLRLFAPESDPEMIRPKRPYAKRTRYFARNELSRLCMDALRDADGALIATDAIAGRIIEAKGFDTADTVLRKAIGEQALAILRSFRKRGSVEQIGLGRGTRWRLVNGA